MALNELKNKVKEFENKEIVSHEIMDLQVFILQLANRFDTDLEDEWNKHFEKSKKYLK